MQELLQRIGVTIDVAFFIVFFSLIWVRILMMTSVTPFLFGKPVPRYVLVAASFVLAAFAFPNLIPKNPPALSEDRLQLVMLFLKEIFYGLSMGMAVSVIFHAFSSVGQMVDNQRGMSIARVLIPQLGEQGSVTGLFLFQFAIVIYLSMGGHLVFLDTFFQSFRSLPLLEFPEAGPGMLAFADFFIKLTGEVVYIALQLSMPVIIAIFLADLILGLANRVAPQINVWMLGFQIKGYLGVLMVFIALTMIGEQIESYTNKANDYAGETVQFLEGKIPEGFVEIPMPDEGMPATDVGPAPVITK